VHTSKPALSKVRQHIGNKLGDPPQSPSAVCLQGVAVDENYKAKHPGAGDYEPFDPAALCSLPLTQNDTFRVENQIPIKMTCLSCILPQFDDTRLRSQCQSHWLECPTGQVHPPPLPSPPEATKRGDCALGAAFDVARFLAFHQPMSSKDGHR